MIALLQRAARLLGRPTDGWGEPLPESPVWLRLHLPGLVGGALVFLVAVSVQGMSMLGLAYKMPWMDSIPHAVFGVVAGALTLEIAARTASGTARTFGATTTREQGRAIVGLSWVPLVLVQVVSLLPFGWLLFVPANLLGGLQALRALHAGLGAWGRPQRPAAYTATVVAVPTLFLLLLLMIRACAGLASMVPTDLIEEVADARREEAEGERPADAGSEAGKEPSSGGVGGEVGRRILEGLGLGAGGDIPPGEAGSPDPGKALEGILYPAMDVPSRSMLEDLVPDEIDGMKRKKMDSWVMTGQGAQMLAGASVIADFEDPKNRDRYVQITVADQTEKGKLAADILRNAVAAEGETTTASDGTVKRTMIQGDQIVVTTWHERGRRGTYELIVGERYSVQASGRLAPDALEPMARAVDIAALKERAAKGAPVE